MSAQGRTAREQTVALPPEMDLTAQAVIQGVVICAGRSYARLLDHSGEFTGELVVSDDGTFRFFASPGSWIVRVIAGGGVHKDVSVEARPGEISHVQVIL
ncbi:DUF1416 domain-containing protein [Streptosporangium sp. 'caverna']|uniref:DUF1416 domain-containing protein n=1 Tax=Streptosporangium sp. 'caverna' TaxID=2202249 RepID=UPI000D7E2687|nr:DUF1416 domain-containing protein [Streptosporangium sp. 'caverna']AWS44221.1 hypothetical protein DKM19_25600 [Streptosporangium sp. 'caverna']